MKNTAVANLPAMTNAAFHWARKLVFPKYPTRISESELGSRGARRIPEFPTWKYDFRLQWNDIFYWETRKYVFPSTIWNAA